MKKFSEYLNESLAAEVKSEPKTRAAKEARQMGLTYMGFGRYADRSGKFAYIVHNDQLYPAEKMRTYTKTYDQMKDKKNPEKAKAAADEWKQAVNVDMKRSSEDEKIVRSKRKAAKDTHKALINFYKRLNFDKEEQQAIAWYTADGYEPINKYLYKGHEPDVDHEEAKIIEDTINALDDAFIDTEAPFPYSVYTGLSSRYKAENFKVGGEYVFRGYISTSLDFSTSIDVFTEAEDRTDSPVVIQLDLKKGQKSIYVDGISANSGELETLLPRGSRMKVISGPHPIHDEAVSIKAKQRSIMLFHCELVEDK